MIKEPQSIKIKIVRPNIAEWYHEHGYNNIKVGDTITIEAKDICPNSHQKITYICDYCGQEYQRMPYSAYRSRLIGTDACARCSRKKASETTLLKYGVTNAMQKDGFLRKQRESCKTSVNFQKKNKYSVNCFKEGIPVSMAQENLAKCLSDFQLNYPFGRYYIDLCNGKVAIEYDGSGHDLSVRVGKISLEDFKRKEETRRDFIRENFRLLQIRDLKDRFKKTEKIEEYIDIIRCFINEGNDFLLLEIS